jgi:predicted phage-related endonuclease
MIEVHKVTDRASWLQLRMQDLTASDLGAAIGKDRYKSRLALYAEKTGMLMPQDDNPSMRRGRWLEAAVLSAIREENPSWDVSPSHVYLRDTEIRLGATPDAIAQTDEPGITNVQCKVVARPAYERDWVDGPPLNYVLQTLAEGMLLDAPRSLIAALVIDTYTAELNMHPVPRHEAAEARVRAIATEFWSNVAAGLQPAVDGALDSETINALYPNSVADPVLDLTGDNRLPELLAERAVAKAIIDLEADRVAEIDTEIKAKLGDAERAELPGWKISWKTQTKAEHMVRATSFRVLRIKELEREEAA